MSSEDLLQSLRENKTLIIDKLLQQAVEPPNLNKKCPCGSKKVYKKCECFQLDRMRTNEFVESKSKPEPGQVKIIAV